MQGKWIQQPQGDVSVIFVHGILSSGKASWRHANGTYWPDLLTQTKTLEGVGVYVFTYRSDIFSGHDHLGDAVDSLKQYLHADRLLESRHIIFVGHSVGGIVVRQLLVGHQAAFIERQIAVGLFLVASPFLGASYVHLLFLCTQVLGHSQARALRVAQKHGWFNDLDWNLLQLKAARKVSLTGKELVEEHFIVLHNRGHQQVVQPLSGVRYFGEPSQVSGADHATIATPADSEAVQHRWLCRFILDMRASQPHQPPSPPTGMPPDMVVPVPEEHIAAVRTLLAHHLLSDPYPDLVEGMRVRIKRGVLQGVEGTLIDKRHGHRLVVRIELIQQSVDVDVDSANVEPLSLRP
jgi:pimeloyl-ACP methyl ester carboxylesterase